MDVRRRLGSVIVMVSVLASLAGCGDGGSASAAPPPGVAWPSGGWPPFAVAVTSPPAGVVLVVDAAGEATLRNESQHPVWVAPPTIEVWQGDPWVEGDVPDGTVGLDPVQELSRQLEPSDQPRRVGVRVWPSEETVETATRVPWFLWVAVEASKSPLPSR